MKLKIALGLLLHSALFSTASSKHAIIKSRVDDLIFETYPNDLFAFSKIQSKNILCFYGVNGYLRECMKLSAKEDSVIKKSLLESWSKISSNFIKDFEPLITELIDNSKLKWYCEFDLNPESSDRRCGLHELYFDENGLLIFVITDCAFWIEHSFCTKAPLGIIQKRESVLDTLALIPFRIDCPDTLCVVGLFGTYHSSDSLQFYLIAEDGSVINKRPIKSGIYQIRDKYFKFQKFKSIEVRNKYGTVIESLHCNKHALCWN